MMAVMDRRWWQNSVTSSAVDFDPKPLAPTEPVRYFTISSIYSSFLLSFFFLQFAYLFLSFTVWKDCGWWKNQIKVHMPLHFARVNKHRSLEREMITFAFLQFLQGFMCIRTVFVCIEFLLFGWLRGNGGGEVWKKKISGRIFIMGIGGD